MPQNSAIRRVIWVAQRRPVRGLLEEQRAEGARVITGEQTRAGAALSVSTGGDWREVNGRAWTRTTEIGHEILETIWSPSTRGWLIALLMAVVVVLASWLAVRLVVTRRDLDPNRRISLLVLPTETFDPTDEEVDRYAAQLSRTRRTLGGLTGFRGQAVRLRLDSVGDGRCAYRIEGSARAASILQLTGFDQVELRPGDRLGPEVGTGLSAPLDAPDGPLGDHGANRLAEGGQPPQEGPPGQSPTDADRPGTAARTRTDDPAEEPQP